MDEETIRTVEEMIDDKLGLFRGEMHVDVAEMLKGVGIDPSHEIWQNIQNIVNNYGGGGGTNVQIATTTEAAQADDNITCTLNRSGAAIEAYAFIAGGGNLDDCIPQLTSGQEIPVFYVSVAGVITWYVDSVFQAIDKDKGLEISSNKLAINIDTTELQFTVSGAIATKLDECPLD